MSSSHGWPRCAMIMRSSGNCIAIAFELQRRSPLEAGLARERRSLVPDDRDAPVVAELEQWPVPRVFGVEVLVDGSQLETPEPERIDRVFELREAAGIVRVDRGPAGDLLGMSGRVLGDQLVGNPDPDGASLQTEDNDPVCASGRVPVLVGPRVVTVQVKCAARTPRRSIGRASPTSTRAPHSPTPRRCGPGTTKDANGHRRSGAWLLDAGSPVPARSSLGPLIGHLRQALGCRPGRKTNRRAPRPVRHAQPHRAGRPVVLHRVR